MTSVNIKACITSRTQEIHPNTNMEVNTSVATSALILHSYCKCMVSILHIVCILSEGFSNVSERNTDTMSASENCLVCQRERVRTVK